MSLGFRLRLFVISVVFVGVPFFVAAAVLPGHHPPAAIAPIAIGFALVTAPLLVALASRWIARDIHRITEAASRLAAGDWAIRTRMGDGGDGTDEVASLGGALDRLAESLSSAMGDLRAERDLVASILDGMQEGVLLLDAKANVGLINPTLRDILLLTNDVVGRPFIEVVRHSALTELLDTVRTSRSARSTEIELGGLKPRRLLVRVSPLAANGADTRALLAVFVDVTDLRRLESMRRDFVANVSHELRTPVTAVASAAETLAAGALNDAVACKKFVDIIERNTERLRSLIDDLLDLSRIEAKEFKLQRESIDLTLAMHQMLGGMRGRAEQRRVEIVIDVDDGARTVVADRRALEQVLVNLVENAVKYCPGTKVRVTARPRAAGAGVVLAVSDAGPGIEPRHLTRLFERFYRVDPGRSRELGGTGLGLSIVKHLVEALGGTVTVASTVGVGTTFTIDLPTREDSSPKLPPLQS